MRACVCIALACAVLVAGCAGRAANPVQVYMPGDENRSCEALQAEMVQNQQEIAEKKEKVGNKAVTNVILGVTGFFVIVPWFFMDLKGAEETEIEALQQRYKRLVVIATEKGCSFIGADGQPMLEAAGESSEQGDADSM